MSVVITVTPPLDARDGALLTAIGAALIAMPAAAATSVKATGSAAIVVAEQPASPEQSASPEQAAS